jgi:hypothetical protein
MLKELVKDHWRTGYSRYSRTDDLLITKEKAPL